MFCFSWFVAFILVVLMSCLIVVVVVYSFSELFVNTSELSNFIYQTSVNVRAFTCPSSCIFIYKDWGSVFKMHELIYNCLLFLLYCLFFCIWWCVRENPGTNRAMQTVCFKT